MTSRHIPAPALTLRVAGLALLLAGAAAVRVLTRLAALPSRHPATSVELGLATIGFLCVSAGAALSVLGGHIFDRVAVSARWQSYR